LGFEIQKNPYDLAYNSVAMNELEDKIKIIHDDLANALEYILPETIDVVTVNPPYFKYDPDSNINMEREKAIARHEIETNLDNIFRSAKYILKNKGTLYMVHRPERLSEIINKMSEYKFAVKRLQFVYSDYNKSAIMVLIKATKNGLDGIKVNPPINVMKHSTYKGIFG
jgi:tRNA1(Val) A37 N6-methylase TrmN6